LRITGQYAGEIIEQKHEDNEPLQALYYRYRHGNNMAICMTWNRPRLPITRP